jgi:hypothetical protein
MILPIRSKVSSKITAIENNTIYIEDHQFVACEKAPTAHNPRKGINFIDT